MKITTTREELLAPVQTVVNVIERRQTLPILANLLFECDGEQLTITGTDLEVELRYQQNVTDSDSGRFTLPGRKLLDICKALPEGTTVTVEITGEQAVMKAGRGRYRLSILGADDYPTIDVNGQRGELTVPSDQLKWLIEQTQFAMAQQDVRYYLNGMYIEIEGNTLRHVATDGHRLALAEVKLDGEPQEPMSVILPRKAVLELSRLLKSDDTPVHLSVSESHLVAQEGGWRLVSKLVDGRFPEYRRVIPAKTGHALEIDRLILRDALVRASVLSNEKYRGIGMDFTEGQLQLSAHNPEHEESEESLDVAFQGDKLSIGFNVSYFLDVLNVVKAESVVLNVIDSNSSCLIEGVDENTAQFVVMPMRL